MPLDPRRAWLGAAAGLASVGWGANQFASLIVLYRRDLGVSATATGAMFGLYAVGLVPGLLLGGRVSDRIGRRAVLAIAVLACGLASAILMLGGITEAALYVGRFVAGVGAGLGFAAGTAWVAELSPAGTAARRATIAMTAGFGGGPVVAGLVAVVAPAPEALAYVPHLLTVVLALPVVLRTPDARVSAPDPALPPAPRLRSLLGHYLAVQLPLAPWVFGSAAIAIAYLPAIVTADLGDAALAVTALLTGLAPVSGILVQPVARRAAEHGNRTLVASAMTLLIVGLVVAALTAAARSPWLGALTSILLGAAFGTIQFTGLREMQRVADARVLGLATAIYQVLSYVGFAFPFVLSSLQAGTGIAAATAVSLLVVVALLCAVWLVAILPRTRWGST